VVTLVTVTFAEDARLSVLQALSVDRLFELNDLAEYLVIVNDPRTEQWERLLRDELERRIGARLWARTRFIHAEELAAVAEMRGWKSQQVIKLEVARQVGTDHYLLLDAKNHFIRPATLGDFWQDGRIVTHVKARPQWRSWVQAAFDALGAEPSEHHLAEPYPTTTPYLLITAEVRALLARIEERHGALAEVFADMGSATEFFLYYAHLVDRYGDDMPYVGAEPRVRALFRRWPQDPRQVETVLSEAVAEDVPVLGIHRERLPQLSSDQRRQIEHIWRRHLLRPHEDADWFLRSDPIAAVR
jgi:hypothetical protein